MSEHSPRERNGRSSSSYGGDRRRSPSEKSESRGREKRERDDKRNKDPETYTQIYVAKLHRRTREEDLK